MKTLIWFMVAIGMAGILWAAPARPLVGAIRWDAWTGGEGTALMERTLGPDKYHDRLPWFAEVVGSDTVKINGGRQEIMDREIDYAAGAGLNYWAFVTYTKEATLSRAIEMYLASEKRSQINFCLILHGNINHKDESWPQERERMLGLLREPGYQGVLNGRPLIYTFGDAPNQAFEELLRLARERGINPYCVYMGWNPTADYMRVRKHGYDAVSAYAMGSSCATFAELVHKVQHNYWANATQGTVPYIPLVTTGWDKRPRKDNPVPWEIGHSYHGQAVFPAAPSAAEIAAHLRDALAFVRENPRICAANAIVIYAWNEHDEGGWLVPTRGANGQPDTSRLDAIRPLLYRPDQP